MACEQLLQRVGEAEVAPFDAIHAALGEQAARPSPPAAGLGQLARKDHAVAEPEREPDRARHVALVERGAMAARQLLAASGVVAG
jgi:hypothetical protein